jgi:hypothetical protein
MRVREDEKDGPASGLGLAEGSGVETKLDRR